MTRNTPIYNAAAALAILLFCPKAWACYSGLVIIPTADMLKPGHFSVELQFDGLMEGPNTETRLLNAQLGFHSRLEAGLDLDWSPEADPFPLVNAKLLLVEGKDKIPAVAIGVANVEFETDENPYLVATGAYNKFRGHLGAIRIDDVYQVFVGADYAATDRLTLMADFTDGLDSYSSVGGQYDFSDNFAVMAGAMIPNSNNNDLAYSVHLVLAGP